MIREWDHRCHQTKNGRWVNLYMGGLRIDIAWIVRNVDQVVFIWINVFDGSLERRQVVNVVFE